MHTHRLTSIKPLHFGTICLVVLILILLLANAAEGRPPIRANFFTAYPSAVGTRLDDLPSKSKHCGVCHYDFGGGGTRNPYGQAVEATPDRTPAEILALGGGDADGDGFINNTEITDTVTYVNTPTFPGLTPANVGNTATIPLAEIQPYLVPSVGADMTPPTVTLMTPNGGEMLTANTGYTVMWNATDAGGIGRIDLYSSGDNGATFQPVALGLTWAGAPGDQSYTWFPPNRPTMQARFRVVAQDNAFNTNQDDSNTAFTILSPLGGVAPTTLRDFDQPGTQPLAGPTLSDPANCAACHGNYDMAVEPHYNWQGSMMSQASRDPLFLACLAVANQDAPDSGDLCLRCHLPTGWLAGRSVPTDGTQMLASDRSGVSCDLCHRLVDPVYDHTSNPMEDEVILAALSPAPNTFANGMYIVDPDTGRRRGPYNDAVAPHNWLFSPFHREAALCGTCHDVSNPAFSKDVNGNYPPNTFDAPETNFTSTNLMPIERTYSEWLNSEYATAGVYAPEFAGNKPDGIVGICQDCHMRDVSGVGCNITNPMPPVRADLPLHDLTGGSTWLPGLISLLYPGEVNDAALQAGILRARDLLQKAADLSAVQDGTQLEVTVTNNTGHKLPSGYPEGRRIWINVRFHDESMTLIRESGAYDPGTGILTHDDDLKVYEAKPGLDTDTAGLVGVSAGPSFHFVLNNRIYKDNRIPPRGFTNTAFAAFGGAPVAYGYSDGQYWDETEYTVPAGAAAAEITLYYQSTSKEYVEFLRDENETNTAGQVLYDLWNNSGKCPPEAMATFALAVFGPDVPADFDRDSDVDLDDFGHFQACATGPDLGPVAPGCQDADLDHDNDADQTDFGLFQRCISGAQQLADPACAG